MPPKNIALKKRIRRRIGARNYKNYTEDMLLLAVDLVRNKNTTSYEAEKQFGIPRRTIEKRVKNLHTDKPGPRFRLSQEEELKFVKVLIAAGDFGCPLSQLDLKLAVYDYLKKNNKTHVFNDRIPGGWWVKKFLERYKNQLTSRSVQIISRARAEKTLEDFKEYLKNHEDETNEDILCSVNSKEKVNKEVTEDSRSKKSSQSRKITILSDIKNTAENKAYFDLRKYGPFNFQAVNTNQKLKIKTTEANTNMLSVKINENTGFIQTETTVNTEIGTTGSEKPEEKILINYNVNDYILIRYVLKNKTQYYVAQITEKFENKYYEVSCFKRIGKKDNIKFVQPKKRDMDTINEGMIVKEVQLLPLNEKETEFVFLDDDNSVYFDY